MGIVEYFIGVIVAYLAFALVILALCIIGWYRLFEKSGVEGWKAIVPFYNLYMLNEIVFGQGWYFAFGLIPVVNVIYAVALALGVAKAFGKSIGFALGLIFLFPIFIVILGFDNSEYEGIVDVKSLLDWQ